MALALLPLERIRFIWMLFGIAWAFPASACQVCE